MKYISKVVWVPGKRNLDDPGKEPDIPLTPAMLLLLYTGKFLNGFDLAEPHASNHAVG